MDLVPRITDDDSEIITIPYKAWRGRHDTFAEADARIRTKYADLHGRDSDYSKGDYGRSLEKEDTLVRIVRDTVKDRLDAVWILKRQTEQGSKRSGKNGSYLKMRSSWWRDLRDLDRQSRESLFDKLQSIAQEQGIPLIMEPDMNDVALADTFNTLGLSAVWNEGELSEIMGEDYVKTHEVDSKNKYSHLRFKVTNTLGRTGLVRRAYVAYPEWMVRKKTVVRGVVEHGSEVFMMQKDDSSSQPGLWEFPGGGVDAGETEREAFEREMTEETFAKDEILGRAGFVGRVRYQFWKDHQPQQSDTAVHHARFRDDEARPEMGFTQGTKDHHQSAGWQNTREVWNGVVPLTRPCDLIRRNFEI